MILEVAKVVTIPVKYTIELTLDEEGASSLQDMKNDLLDQTCYDDVLVGFLSDIIKECK